MLLATNDLVVLKEVHKVTMDDVFEDFEANICQRYGSVFGWLTFISLSDDCLSSHRGSFLVSVMLRKAVSIGLSGAVISVSSLEDMSSEPEALWGFRFLSSFLTPSGCTDISSH